MPETIGRRYQLMELIGQGGMGTVYRALDRLTGETIALKRVLSPANPSVGSSQNSTNTRLALAQEFKLLASLRHPNIISVLDYGFDNQRQPFITMSLLQNHATILEYGADLPVAQQIDLVIQLLQAVAYLHRRGILHRDLKPSNVMIMEDQVRVLDFGLAILRDEKDVEQVVGTMAYIAPEVLLGEAVTEAADLYAIGIMAYELIAGKHPYSSPDPNIFLMKLMESQPDLDLIARSESALAPIFGRLLAKRPADRYQDVDQVILEVCDALQRPPPQETIAIRESFLQSAKFVGRTQEIQELTFTLEQMIALSNPQTTEDRPTTERPAGALWLVGGESGVGKSRLLDELRTRALVRGAQVLRGQAKRERGFAFALWRDALRWLCLIDRQLSDLEIGILKDIVPDIETLVEREVPVLPPLDPQGTQERLLTVIENLLMRQHQPLLLILEDVHWANPESLLLLNRIRRPLKFAPLVIVCSYRDDERPDLPEHIPGARLMKLQRLEIEGITELSASMLGKNGLQPQVIDVLQRESEGNIFFLIEVVRALAEDAGRLDLVGQTTMPINLFVGGVKQVIQRRLDRVPETGHDLLRTAAVYGRQLDLRVLGILNAQGARLDLEEWLLTCANASVLEVFDGEWRFAHDKLREGLLTDISPEDRRKLHRRVAEAIEQGYQDDPAQVNALVHHWAQAGDILKEQHYTAQAGIIAWRMGAHGTSVGYMERALALCIQTNGSAFDQAYILTYLGASYYALSQFERTILRYDKAFELMGHAAPTGTRLYLGIARQIIHQVYLRVRERLGFPVRVRPRSPAQEIISQSTHYVITLYIVNESWKAVFAMLRMINQMEYGDPSSASAWGYASLGYAAGVFGISRVADYYITRGMRAARQTESKDTIMTTLEIAVVHYQSMGEWQIAQTLLQETIELGEALGNWNQLGDCLQFQAENAYFQGDWRTAHTVYKKLWQVGLHANTPLQLVWGELGYGMVMMRAGDTRTAFGHLKRTLELAENLEQTRSDLVAYALMITAYLRMGDEKHAIMMAETLEKTLDEKIPIANSYFLYDIYIALNNLYLELVEKYPQDKHYQQKATKMGKWMTRYARSFPIGRARNLLFEGWRLWLAGKHDKAYETWCKSIATAHALHMVYDEALAHYEIVRRLAVSDVRRGEHLYQALELFNQIESGYELAELGKL